MARLITANKIHDGKNWLAETAVLEVSEDGLIIGVHQDREFENVEFYEGTLCPGFVNVHCHLELSHTKGLIEEHTTLIPFLQKVMQHRFQFSDEQKKAARHNAYNELIKNGVVAVGDICNTIDTSDLRALGKLHFHSFSEAIGFTEDRAGQSFQAVKEVNEYFSKQAAAQNNCLLHQSIVPHAPYSVSSPLFQMINEFDLESIVCIHNQESEEENKFYQNKSGKINDLLDGFNIDTTAFIPTGKTSLQSYLPCFSKTHPFIFVHSTYTRAEDIQFVESCMDKAFWCLCPNANLYIENKLPDIQLLKQSKAAICLGTDSLASNHQLSIFSEMQTLKKHFPDLEWEELIAWGTYNGAKALQMEQIIGSFEKGKNPGIIQISNLESADASIRRII